MYRWFFPLWGFLVLLNAPMLHAWEFRSEIGTEFRYFPQSSSLPLYRQGYSHNGSIYALPEVYHEWNDGSDQFRFIPFGRIDEHDDNRTHGDIRELSWLHVADGWESRVGIRKVFWGVTEGLHLVDIINQTDLVENLDAEEKLGQPMINVSTVRDWGIFDVYLLPGFRERTFPSKDGRLRAPLVIDDKYTLYESSRKDKRTDFAVRWQMYMGGLEIALSHFSGTSREPRFVPDFMVFPWRAQLLTAAGPAPGYLPTLIPLYEVIDQTGVEMLWVKEGWLWKLETISRSGQGERFTAATGGFEYTQVGVLGSFADLGWIVEYLWEDRPRALSSPTEHDWLFGARLTMNDIASTEALLAMIYDPTSGEKAITLESSRRFGDRWKGTLEARVYSDAERPPSLMEILAGSVTGAGLINTHKLSPFSRNDYIQAELVYYF